jgi:hypothetical protein
VIWDRNSFGSFQDICFIYFFRKQRNLYCVLNALKIFSWPFPVWPILQCYHILKLHTEDLICGKGRQERNDFYQFHTGSLRLRPWAGISVTASPGFPLPWHSASPLSITKMDLLARKLPDTECILFSEEYCEFSILKIWGVMLSLWSSFVQSHIAVTIHKWLATFQSSLATLHTCSYFILTTWQSIVSILSLYPRRFATLRVRYSELPCY